MAIRAFLRSTGLPERRPARPTGLREAVPGRRACTASRSRRPRARAASTAVLEEAERLDVRVHRVSQGSGVFMQTDAELDEMARTARAAQRRGLAVRAAERRVGALGDRARARRLRGRCARPGAGRREPRGLRSRRRPRLPLGADRRHRRARPLSARRVTPACCRGDMQAKVSVMLPAANPAAARVLERPRRLDDQPADRPDAGADRSDPRGRRRAARRLRRGAGQRRRVRPPPRDPGADPRRLAGLRQVRAAQRTRRLSGRLAPRGDDGRAQPRARPPRAPRSRVARALRLRAIRPPSSAPPGSPSPVTVEKES